MYTDLPIIAEIEVLKSQRRYKEARKKVEHAISRHPRRHELYEELADVFIFEGNFKKAEKALDFSEGIMPGTPTSTYLRGYIALIQNRFVEAILFLEESNFKNPNNPEVLRNLGWAYTMIGEHRKGMVVLERALTLSPEDELIIEDIGVALLTQGKTKEARDYLRKIGKEGHIKSFGYLA